MTQLMTHKKHHVVFGVDILSPLKNTFLLTLIAGISGFASQAHAAQTQQGYQQPAPQQYNQQNYSALPRTSAPYTQMRDAETRPDTAPVAPPPPQKSLWEDAIPDFSRPKDRFRIHLELMGVDASNKMYNAQDNSHFTLGAGLGFGLSIFISKHFAMDFSDFVGIQGILGDEDNGALIVSSFTFNPQYHVWPDRLIDPYFGLGGALYNPIALSVGGDVETEKFTPGLGFNVEFGVDFNISRHFYLGLNAKKLWAKFTDEQPSEAEYFRQDVDPWMFALRLGWRF